MYIHIMIYLCRKHWFDVTLRRFPGTHDDPYLQQWLSVMPGKERTPSRSAVGVQPVALLGTAVLMNSRPRFKAS